MLLSKRCLIFADLSEALATLAHFNASLLEENRYHTPIGEVLITGWGAENARYILLKHIERYDEIWNIGFAGAINGKEKLFSIHPIALVGTEASPPLSLSETGKRLLTVSAPLHDRDGDFPDWDLVDMEGYAIAEETRGFRKNCRLWKIVSDFASHGGSALIEKNKEHLSQTICRFLIDESSRHS